MNVEELPVNDDWTASDWRYVFPLGTEDDAWVTPSYSGAFSVHDSGQVEDITADRIARVDLWFGESPEGGGSLDFAALVELTDGTWATCLAWADYTGWGCQDDVQWKWAHTREDAISQGLDRRTRERLGVPLSGEVTS